jgi:choline dehydrogenase-like flavoprotein
MKTDPQDILWDVIVIGTGIGGGTLGRRLAEKGKSVLFLERGPTGRRAEEHGLDPDMGNPVARTVRGFWPSQIQAKLDGIETRFFGPLGAGVGGSSVFYAATLERPEQHDLDDTPEHPHPTGGWPVGFDTMRPYFDDTEALFHICGYPDPLGTEPQTTLRAPPAISSSDQSLFGDMEAQGLHPYHAHSAIKYVDGCKKCLGFKCSKSCKMDGRSAGVEPALATGHATLLDMCVVTRLRASEAGGIDEVEALHRGVAKTFRAKRYVLAAGALSSPRIFQASDLPDQSDQVGRNLMFHMNEMFAIWPRERIKNAGPSKDIALRDLYFVEGERQGMIQALGVEARYGEIVHFLNGAFDRSILRKIKPLRHFTRVLAVIAIRMFGDAKIFVGILEDLPYPENRVHFSPENPDEICVTYEFAPELKERRKRFRSRIKRAFKGLRLRFLSHQIEPNFGHPCGTMRFGNHPDSSVLNANCRAHGVGNLYVVDASFMPTSCGVNPSLTIAANALRVADHIADTLDAGKGNLDG